MLDLNELARGMHAVTPEYGAVLAQAAAVCLEQEDHQQGVALTVTGLIETQHELRWPPMTAAMVRSYNEETRATELGAVGLALLLVRDLTGLTAVSQSRIGTGFDYWLGKDSGSELPLVGDIRLEVSGIRHGSVEDVKRRVSAKLSQMRRTDQTGKPALVVVVEFGTPLAEVR